MICVAFAAFCLLIFSVKNSEEVCNSYKIQIVCDSLNDLYNTNNTLISDTIIISQKKNNFRILKVVPAKNAANIEHLKIEKAIYEIEEDAFKNFVKINYIILTLNDLETIPTGIFRNLPVRSIDFYSDGIVNIAQKAFVNLPNLQTIRFNHNNLTRIQKEIFNNLSVTTLSLSHNQISVIEKQAFGNMSSLRRLYLDNNRLSKFVAKEHVDHPDLLERLWLHGNNLTEVTIYMLEGLKNLKVLNLGFNSIASIEPKAFAETMNLNVLVLTNNALKVLNGDILPSGLQIRTLYLDHNRLTFLSSNFLFKLNSLKAISIGGNPWQCPCLDLIFRWLHDLEVKMKCDKTYFDGQRPICVVPDRPNCVYSYNENHYQIYQKQNSMYPPPQFCLL